jgi:hypothetical protein
LYTSFGVLRDQAVAQVHDLAVHGQLLHRLARAMQNGAARRLVDAAALHAHEPVLYQINAAHAVLAAEFVQRLHDPQRAQLLAVHRHRVARP